MSITITIDPATERAARDFIAKGAMSLGLVSAILFGGSYGNAP